MTAEKQLTEQLRQHEQYVSALFESSSILVGLLDLQGRFLRVNQAALDRFGYSMEDFQRMTVRELTHPHDQQITPGYIARILSGEMQSWRGEKRYLLKDGAICYLDLSVNPLRGQGGNVSGFLALGVDITERRNALAALVENERRLRNLMSNLPGMVFRYQAHPGRPGWGGVEFVSEGSLALTGYSPSELYDKGMVAFASMVHPQDRTRIQDVKQQAFKGCDSYELEYRMLTKQGELRWVWERSRVLSNETEELVLVEGFVTDITTRKEHEEKLVRLQAVVEHASESIVITDLDGIILYVNPAFTELTGYSREEAIGKRPNILKSGLHDQEFYKTMWETLMRGETWQGHLVNQNKTGVFFEEEATITPIIDASGEICHFVGIKRNVTREVDLKRQLQQAQRMEAIGTLAGGIAHDFNNILASIIGYAEIARDQLTAVSPARDSVAQVIRAGDRAAHLVKQILAFSRQDEEELCPISLQQTLQEVLSLLRSSLPSTITLQYQIDPECPPILADVTQIHQVVMNLCVNARQSIGNNQGRISVVMDHMETKEPLVAVNGALLQPGFYVMLEVSDDGCGMSTDIQAKVFDPFFSTRTHSEGTGLGLSLVHGIVRKYGGAINLVSAPGAGTTFRLYLPVCQETIDADEQDNVGELRGTETVLVVDDELLLVQMLHDGLARLGYHVIPFSSSMDALTYFTSNRDSVDLVVTDMTMPIMAGDVFCRELRLLKPELPIILCTGFSEAIDEARALSIGIREFIMKPVAPRNLAQAMRTIFDDGKHTDS